MKKILNGVLVMLFVFIFGVFSVNALDVNTEDELVSCVTAGGTCKLVSNIVLASSENIASGIIIDKDVTIDLNGYDITSSDYGNGLFTVTHGNVKFIGSGKIIADRTKHNYTTGIRVKGAASDEGANYSVVTIDKDVFVSASYGVFITHNNKHAYGAVVNVYGTIDGQNAYAVTVNGNNKDKTGNVPIINIYDGAKIYALEVDGDDEGIPLYCAGYAIYNIGKAELKGIGNGIGIKAGILTLNGTELLATGEDKSGTVSLYNNGMHPSGAALQIESNAGYADSIEIYLNNAKLVSEKDMLFLNI